jgi:hypothetical protein
MPDSIKRHADYELNNAKKDTNKEIIEHIPEITVKVIMLYAS